MRGVKTEWIKVKSGVPQGSILGPILFLVYMDDLDEGINSSIYKFADDTKVIGEVNVAEQRAVVVEDLKRIECWAKKWQISFNTEKCKVMHLGRTNSMAKYYMGGIELQETREEKDLGVVFESSFKSSVQSARVARKANRVLGLIKRTFRSRSKKILVTLYKSLVRPFLDY